MSTWVRITEIKKEEGEVSSCRAHRLRLNNAWICGGMALEHMQGFKIKWFAFQLLAALPPPSLPPPPCLPLETFSDILKH